MNKSSETDDVDACSPATAASHHSELTHTHFSEERNGAEKYIINAIVLIDVQPVHIR